MQVINHDHLVTNFEVLELVKARIAARRERSSQGGGVATGGGGGGEEGNGGPGAAGGESSGLAGAGHGGGIGSAGAVHDRGLAGRDYVELRLLNFLEDSPSATQSRESIMRCWNALDDFIGKDGNHAFTTAEKLQLINYPPTELVEVHLMVEDCHKRMNDSQTERLTETIKEALAGADGSVAGGAQP